MRLLVKKYNIILFILLIVLSFSACGEKFTNGKEIEANKSLFNNITPTIFECDSTEKFEKETLEPNTSSTQAVAPCETPSAEKETNESSEKTPEPAADQYEDVGNGEVISINPESLPDYSGIPYTVVNNNVPNFISAELSIVGYEKYGPLDELGRCSVAIASCGREIMPYENEERGSIQSIKPTGWVQASYEGISGGYLWNRCHLIGWQLSSENANRQNLITGTRYMNVEGMLTFENMVADYIKETNNHVAYRVTPIFVGNNLVCSGVQIEAYSIEDHGEGICLNVYCYNVQPGIIINYATGESKAK